MRAKADKSLNGIKKMYKEDKNKALKVADQIIKNTYRTLMSRCQKGFYIYCLDEGLRDYLRERLNKFYKPIEYTSYSAFGKKKNKAAEDDQEYS